MSLRAVFLDFGGTLARERLSRAEIHAEEARREGLAVDARVMAACMARAHAALPRELEGAFRYSDAWFRAFQRRILVDELGLDPGRLPAVSARLFARFEAASTFELFPHALELLGSLRERGLRVGVVSNWSERLPRLLATLGLGARLDFVVSSATAGVEKPDPAIFRLACERAGVAPEACLHAGDHVERDALGALGAGISAVLVDHAGSVAGLERVPCPVVHGLAELAERILERAA